MFYFVVCHIQACFEGALGPVEVLYVDEVHITLVRDLLRFGNHHISNLNRACVRQLQGVVYRLVAPQTYCQSGFFSSNVSALVDIGYYVIVPRPIS